MVIHYIASTDIGSRPHVTAQWDDDTLISVTVDSLPGGPLTYREFLSSWTVARKLEAVRELASCCETGECSRQAPPEAVA